jgi:hypothetical protein
MAPLEPPRDTMIRIRSAMVYHRKDHEQHGPDTPSVSLALDDSETVHPFLSMAPSAGPGITLGLN